MSIVYWISFFMACVLLLFIITTLIVPIIVSIAILFFPVYWNEWCGQPAIQVVSVPTKKLYEYIAPFLIILTTLSALFIVVVYIIYYYAKFRAPKGDPVANSILNNSMIKEFIEFGIFPFFDKVGTFLFPLLYYGENPEPLEIAFLNFMNDTKKKILEGDGSEKDKVATNPFLTDEQNKVVNDNYEKCIEQNSPGTQYNGDDPFKSLIYQLNITGAKTLCEILKIRDSSEVNTQNKK